MSDRSERLPTTELGLDDICEIIKCRLLLCVDTLPVSSQRFLLLLFFQLFVLQVTILLLSLAGVAHVVDATSAGYTKSVLIATFLPASDVLNLDRLMRESIRNVFRSMCYMMIMNE